MGMKKLLLTLLFLSIVGGSALAQTLQEIQQSDDYLWGMGYAATLKQADNDALAALVSQISAIVSSRFEMLSSEERQGGKISSGERVKSVVHTYSHATLSNAQRLVVQNEPEVVVMRYIRKDEVQRIFEGRKNKLLNYVQEAQKAEKQLRVADALRYYYWAYVLLQSYPDGISQKAPDDTGTEQLLSTWIPRQMDDIFTRISLTIEGMQVADKVKTVTLKVLYKGEPARNYDYSYFDGRDWSNTFSAKDGTGIVELPLLTSAENLQVKTEYMFENEANIDKELSEVMRSIAPYPMKKSELRIMGKEPLEAQPAEAERREAVKADGMKLLATQAAEPYLQAMKKVEAAISRKDDRAMQELCTPAGYDQFRKLIQRGNASVVKQPEYRFLEYGDEVICRSLPMSFSFQGNSRTFVEDVVFYLNKEGKVEEITFGLDKAAVDDILEKTAWSDSVRHVLISFLERYKTAYALKRLPYIRSIFSDNALIITGKVLHEVAAGEQRPLNKEVIRYTRQTKEEYMKNLERVFASNEYINLRFADNQVRKAGIGGEVYGIQIKQDYFSTNYGDTGYLFLIVDLNKPEQPVIHVRTWQPERDPKFGLIDLSHF